VSAALPPPPPPSLDPPYDGGFNVTSGGGTESLRVIGSLARWATLLPLVTAVVGLAGTLLSLAARDEAAAYLDREISEDEFNEAVAPATAATGLSSLVAIAAAVVVVMWCARIARNHRTLGRRTTWSPGMAAGGWFLPPVLFVIPMLFLQEAWRASEPRTGAGDGWRTGRAGPVVYVWWVLFGIVPLAFLPQVVARYSSFQPETDDLAEIIVEDVAWQVGSSVVQMAAAVAWAVLVVGLTARHRRLTGEDAR